MLCGYIKCSLALFQCFLFKNFYYFFSIHLFMDLNRMGHNQLLLKSIIQQILTL